jgi:glycosyltransferase involved in cell wall biosynthesis
MNLSIVIPTLNSQDTIKLTLNSLLRNKSLTPSDEIIICDGGSSDATLTIAKSYNVKIISTEKKGAAVARNIGVRESCGEIICFTDSDCVVSKDWLIKIRETFKKKSDVCGIGGPVLPYPQNSPNNIQKYSDKIFSDIMQFPNKITKVNYKCPIGSLITANSAYRKKDLEDIGLFDETFLTSGEDWDICWRIARKNLLIFNPEIIVYHIFPNNLHDLWKQYFKYGIASSKLKKKFWGNANIDWRLYKLFLISMMKIITPKKCVDRQFHIIRCYQIIAHIAGRVYGSYKERIFNI